MNIVKVVWLDHWGDMDGWVAPEDIASYTPEPVTTVGVLVPDHTVEGAVVIAGSCHDGMYGGIMVIRTNCIVSMEQFNLDSADI